MQGAACRVRLAGCGRVRLAGYCRSAGRVQLSRARAAAAGGRVGGWAGGGPRWLKSYLLPLSAWPWLSRVFCRIRCTDMDFSRSDGAAEVEVEVAAEAELQPAHLPPAPPLAGGAAEAADDALGERAASRRGARLAGEFCSSFPVNWRIKAGTAATPLGADAADAVELATMELLPPPPPGAASPLTNIVPNPPPPPSLSASCTTIVPPAPPPLVRPAIALATPRMASASNSCSQRSPLLLVPKAPLPPAKTPLPSCPLPSLPFLSASSLSCCSLLQEEKGRGAR